MTVASPRTTNFVAGEWVDALGDGTQEVLNPATGEVIATVPAGGEEDVDRAVRAAHRAFAEWFDTTPKERADMLLALAAALEDHAEELAQHRVAQRRQAAHDGARRDRLHADNLRFFAGAARGIRARRRASTCAATRR